MNTLAFSTLAVPQCALPQIIDLAVDNGYSAIEIRGLGAYIDAPDCPELAAELRPAVLQNLKSRGLSVSCVSSSANLTSPSPAHLRAHLQLAKDLKSPLVRVFGGSGQAGESNSDIMSRAVQTVKAYGEIAAEYGVDIVLETHDAFSLGARVAEVLDKARQPNVFALWDLHHPYRNREPADVTAKFMAPYLKYVHVKDGVPTHNTLLGEGDIPVPEMIRLLRELGYDGVLSVEWEKRWQPQIQPGEIALPQYAEKLREYLAA